MKEEISKTEKALVEILEQFEAIIRIDFNSKLTVEKIMCDYDKYDYYNGVLTFSHKEKVNEYRNIYITIKPENRDGITFIELHKARSGRLISNNCDSAELFKLLPTRANIIENILEWL